MRFNLLILIVLCFFMLFLSGEATPSSFLEEELTYLVKAGDQKTFTFSKFLFEGMDEYNVTIDDDNGNPRVIFLKKNSKITFHILEVNDSLIDYQMTIDGVKGKALQREEVYAPLFLGTVLFKTTINKTYWVSFIQEFYDEIEESKEKWIEEYEDWDFGAKLSGDFLIRHSYVKVKDQDVEMFFNHSMNWKTGWLFYYHMTRSEAGNFKTDVEIKTQSRLISGFEGISSLGGLSFLVCVALRLRKRK